MDSIRIDTGEKRVTIADRDGHTRGEIVFNPRDTLFMEKFYKMCGDVSARLEAMQSQSPPEDIESQFAAVEEINAFMRERIDYAFGEGASQIAFGDVVSYDFDIYSQFIDGVKPFIEPVRAAKVAAYIPQTKKTPKRNGHTRKK